MNSSILLFVIAGYFVLLLFISHFTSRGADSKSFYNGNKQSPWYLVAFGMIGASLSGVTFISIPGWVEAQQFSYFQVVLGYLVGYWFIGAVLMPLYYRLNLTSIYGYLETRFGTNAYKTGAIFFLISRTAGAALRLFLVASVMQFMIFSQLGVPFWVTVAITILLIWIYTFRGGIKTIVWTDSLQTLCMLAAVVIAIVTIGKELNLDVAGIVETVKQSERSKMFFFENWGSPYHFGKQFISGAFIATAMTGLDQDMMQKNLSCRNIGEAQKNMFWFSTILVFVNLLFLSLGVLLYIYSDQMGIDIPTKIVNGEAQLATDLLFPKIAQNYLGPVTAIVFFLGLIAAAYSSADSALTSLTTSFCIDILNMDENDSSLQAKQKRWMTHIGFSILLFIIILIANAGNSDAVIKKVFVWAGYTYGPLLGLYIYGLFTKWASYDKLIPMVCIVSPILTYFLSAWLKGLNFDVGFLLLPINGAITFFGLWVLNLLRPKSAQLQ